MPSPFPGMNPYFEQPAHWLDFHMEFLSALRPFWLPWLHRSISFSSTNTSVFPSRTSRGLPSLKSGTVLAGNW